jgi:ribosomal protein L11 methyltransferase
MAELMQRLTDAGVNFSLQTAGIQERDWANAWKDHYHFFALSPRLAVCPSWETCTPKPGQSVIRLDPGMAFGSGTHETTRLCLSLMELFLKPEHSVLDIGCGSGILSIAAALLGANRVVGVDIDPIAVRTARENAANNSVRATFIEGDLNAGLPGPFDLVCANIVADVIIRLAPDIPALLAPKGVCILSGIIAQRAPDVLQALLATGLMPAITRETGGWIAFSCKLCPSDKRGA